MLKEIKWANILVSAAYIISGILLVMYPEVSSNVLCYVVGIAGCVYGVINLTAYFMMDVKRTLHNNQFIIGLLSIIGGILIIVKQSILIELIPIILGLIVVASGLSKLQQAVVAGRIGYDKALVYAVFGSISIIMGLVIMFVLSGQQTVDILFTVIGAALIFCGASDLLATLFLANKFHQFIRSYNEAARQQMSKENAIPADPPKPAPAPASAPAPKPEKKPEGQEPPKPPVQM